MQLDQKAAQTAIQLISDAISILQANKPIDRSEEARRCAVVITELEKTRAVARDFLVRQSPLVS